MNTTQHDNQGIPRGSPSVSFPFPTFNLPPTEHAQALHRNLAAELIHAGSGRSTLLPSRIRFPQEPGTAVSMTPTTVLRRNNLNSSPQVLANQRTVEELRLQPQKDNHMVDELAAQAVGQSREEQLRGFGEARMASVTEARESAVSAQSELPTERQRLSEDREQTMGPNRLHRAEVRNEIRRLNEATTTLPAPHRHALLHRQSVFLKNQSCESLPDGLLRLLGARLSENHSEEAEHIRSHSITQAE